MKHNVFILLILSLFAFFSSGCQKKISSYATIKQDGEVYSIYPDEFTETEKEDNIIKLAIEDSNTSYINYKLHDIQYRNIYNFLVAIPIKSKTDLNSGKFNAPVNINSISYIFYVPDIRVELTNDGYYHYMVVAAATELAYRYLLNDIKDIEIQYDWEESDMSKKKVIKSNKLTIKAEEFEHMLDRLAISHERLSFQPEGY